MIRWLLLLLGGVLLGGIVHLVTMLVLPRTATQDAYARLAPTARHQQDGAGAAGRHRKIRPSRSRIPAFAAAVCRYDLSQRTDQVHRAGEHRLYVGLVLYAQAAWPITPSMTAPPDGASSNSI